MSCLVDIQQLQRIVGWIAVREACADQGDYNIPTNGVQGDRAGQLGRSQSCSNLRLVPRQYLLGGSTDSSPVLIAPMMNPVEVFG